MRAKLQRVRSELNTSCLWLTIDSSRTRCQAGSTELQLPTENVIGLTEISKIEMKKDALERWARLTKVSTKAAGGGSVAASTAVRNHYFTIVAVLNGGSEDRYLREWIEYHLLVGVGHFYLFRNVKCGEVGNHTILAPYVAAKVVTVDTSFCEVEPASFASQAFETSLSKFGPATRWMAFLDVAEFIIIKQPDAEAYLKGQKKTKKTSFIVSVCVSI